MKNDLLRRLEAKAELKYAALYQAKMRMTVQSAQGAARSAANEVLQMGPGRAKEFAMDFTEAVNDIGVMMFEDQQDDKEFVYTKARVPCWGLSWSPATLWTLWRRQNRKSDR